MNENLKDMFKAKGFYIALGAGLCAILVVCYTMSGIKTAGDKMNNLNQAQKDTKEDTNNDLSSNYDTGKKDAKTVTAEPKKEEPQKKEAIADNKTKKAEKKTETNKEEKVSEVISTDNILAGLKFDQESGLSWPVSGSIIKNYSENELVYFQTLGQFKTNPAIFIASNVSTEVKSCYKGVVTAVKKDKEYGNMVEVSIGDNYVLTYGQLKDVAVKEGDTVKEGQLIAKVNTPTGYYSAEGTHLYLKVSEDGKEVNPLLFLK